MRFARRVLDLFRERISLAVGGSLLWWIGERLLDETVNRAMRAGSEIFRAITFHT